MVEFDVAVVTGANGFIGGHLCKFLKRKGYKVVGVDNAVHEYTQDANFIPNEICSLCYNTDLRRPDRFGYILEDIMADYGERVALFALAADMGGMGFISNNHADILHNNLLINIHTLEAAVALGVTKYFYASSVCVYPEGLQMELDELAKDAQPLPIVEGMAYPANPQDAYGWEKLTSEKMVSYQCAANNIPRAIGRFHNCYGPYGAWRGGREKAPAALCRKVAEYKHLGKSPIEVWGDGNQLRPFIYVDDLVEGIWALFCTDYQQPVNIGPSNKDVVSVSDLLWWITGIAGAGTYDIDYVPGPEGVRYRGASNDLIKSLTGWEPKTSLVDGLSKTYEWIEQQVLYNKSLTNQQGANSGD